MENNINITVAGTPGAEILAELHIEETDFVVVKKRYSAFLRTSPEKILKDLKCTSIIFAGINSHACIRTSVIDAYQYDYQVVLVSDCIDSYDLEHHEISMQYMNERLGSLKSNEYIKRILQNA